MVVWLDTANSHPSKIPNKSKEWVQYPEKYVYYPSPLKKPVPEKKESTISYPRQSKSSEKIMKPFPIPRPYILRQESIRLAKILEE